MKAKCFWLISLMLAGLPATSGFAADATRLPPSVKKTLEEKAKGEPVRDVRIEVENGRTVYDIELERRSAPNPRLRIAIDGTLLRDSRSPATTPSEPVTPALSDYDLPAAAPSLRLNDLPEPAQQAIRREAGAREIGAIREDSIDGRAGYMVELREPGRNARFYVGKDGALLRPLEKPPALMLGTTFSDTPVPVRETIRRQIGAGEIVRIEKEGRIGEPKIYKAEIRASDGPFQLRIAENGRVLSDSRGGASPAEPARPR